MVLYRWSHGYNNVITQNALGLFDMPASQKWSHHMDILLAWPHHFSSGHAWLNLNTDRSLLQVWLRLQCLKTYNKFMNRREVQTKTETVWILSVESNLRTYLNHTNNIYMMRITYISSLLHRHWLKLFTIIDIMNKVYTRGVFLPNMLGYSRVVDV